MTPAKVAQVKDHWYWRPGWRVGSRFYTWHITFGDQQEIAKLAGRYRSALDTLPTLDVVPDEWLHLTMQGLGFVDQIQANDVDLIVARTRERCANLTPMPLRVGAPHVDPESIQIAVEPAEAVRALRREIRSAIGEVWGSDGVPEAAEPYTPHMSLAYINSAGPAEPLAEALEAVTQEPAIAHVASCQLIVLNRDNKMYVWEPYATVKLGRD